MLGRGSYLVNYLEGISRRTEEVESDPGRWVAPSLGSLQGWDSTGLWSMEFLQPA
jgi:hypothetical protein